MVRFSWVRADELSSLLPRGPADVNGIDVRCIHAVDNRTNEVVLWHDVAVPSFTDELETKGFIDQLYAAYRPLSARLARCRASRRRFLD